MIFKDSSSFKNYDFSNEKCCIGILGNSIFRGNNNALLNKKFVVEI